MLNKKELDEVKTIIKEQTNLNKDNVFIDKNYKIEKMTMYLADDFQKQLSSYIESSQLKEQLQNKRLYDDQREKYLLSFDDIKPPKQGKAIYLMKDTSETVNELVTLMNSALEGTKEDMRMSVNTLSVSISEVSQSTVLNKFPMEVALEDIKTGAQTINMKPQMSLANRLSLLSKLAENYFQVEEIVAQFIARQGIDKLMKLITYLETQKKINDITYWFNAMTKLFGFLNALQYITEYEGVLDMFYRFFVKYEKNLNLKMSVLQIFSHLNTYYYTYAQSYFFDLLWECALKYASQHNTKPLRELIAPIEEFTENSLGKYNVRCFELIVHMMENSKGKSHVKDMKEKLYTSGLKEALDKLVMRDSQPKELKDLIERYCVITKEELQGTEYEKKKYDERLKKLDVYEIEVKKKEEIIKQERLYFDEISRDFLYFKRLSEVCSDAGGYYDPYVPTVRLQNTDCEGSSQNYI